MPNGCALAAAIVAASLLQSGCAGSGSGLDANGRPLGSGESSGGPLVAEFTSIQEHVFTPICTACHAGGGAPQGLRLDSANSFNLLVGVPSTEVGSILRVKPGDPNNSYLVQKLEGHASVGAQMPLGGPELPAETIAVIRQWISDGAQRSSAAAAATSFKITSIAPASGDVQVSSPPQILIGFDADIDATRIDAGSARIEQVIAVALGTSIEILPVQLTIPTSNPRALLLMPLQPLAAGHYRVILRAANGMGMSDIGGHALAGGPLTEGGDWIVSEFDVEANP
jgi:hypothetical protein